MTVLVGGEASVARVAPSRAVSPRAPLSLVPSPVVPRPRQGGRHRLRPPARPAPVLVRRTLAARCRERAAHRSVGWLVSAGLGLCVAAWVVFAVLSWSGAGGQGAPVPDRTALVQVRSGENLGELARRAAPGSDPDAVVRRIRELNGLDGSDLRAGQPLVVPAGPGFASFGTAG